MKARNISDTLMSINEIMEKVTGIIARVFVTELVTSVLSVPRCSSNWIITHGHIRVGAFVIYIAYLLCCFQSEERLRKFRTPFQVENDKVATTRQGSDNSDRSWSSRKPG